MKTMRYSAKDEFAETSDTDEGCEMPMEIELKTADISVAVENAQKF